MVSQPVKTAAIAGTVLALLPSASVHAVDRGGRIAYELNREILVVDLETGHHRLLTEDAPTASNPSWAPDGMRVAFAALAGTTDHIFVVDHDGENLMQLTDEPLPDGWPDWSPDGGKIAFSRVGALYVMNADGSGVTQVAPDMDITHPSWSPSGAQIAFDARDPIGGDYDIYRIDADGSDLTNLTVDRVSTDFHPDWSPSAPEIVFASDLGGRLELFTVSPDGTSVTRWTHTYAHENNPEWSPGGSAVVAVRFRGPAANIVIIPAQGARARFVTGGPDQELTPSWGPGRE